jgi:hypothetical protein
MSPHDDHRAHTLADSGWAVDISSAVRVASSCLTMFAGTARTAALSTERGTVTGCMTEDRYTSTPEDAAAFERRRAAGEAWDDRPTPAELAEDEWTCMRCGAQLLPHEGAVCRRCEPDGSALIETLVCLVGMAVWLWIAFYCANGLGAWLAS